MQYTNLYTIPTFILRLCSPAFISEESWGVEPGNEANTILATPEMSIYTYYIIYTHTADSSIRDSSDHTALDYAVERGLHYCGLLLSKADGVDEPDVG